MRVERIVRRIGIKKQNKMLKLKLRAFLNVLMKDGSAAVERKRITEAAHHLSYV